MLNTDNKSVLDKPLKLTKYIKQLKEKRVAHIDLDSPCLINTSISRATRSRQGKKALLKVLGLTDDVPNWKTKKIQLCHLCENHSENGWCSNPEHIYIGTASENHQDKKADVRFLVASKGGKKGGPVGASVQRELGIGIYNSGDPRVLEGKRKGGSIRRMCLVTGFVSNAAGLARYQRAEGIPTHLSASLDGRTLISQTALLGLANA